MNSLLNPIRSSVRSFMSQVAKVLNHATKGKISPDFITIIGLIVHIYIAYLIAMQSFTVAAILLVIFGLFDALDGALAREQGSASKSGMLLDSITDRLKEVMLYCGIAYAVVASGKPYIAVWAVLACGLSLLVSYVNAWGEAVIKDQKDKNHTTNRSFRAGFMTFEIRMFVLVIGLLSGYITQAIIFIAVFAFITACERFYIITGAVRNNV